MKQIFENKVLTLALNALKWTDQAILNFTSHESLPEPLDCKPGCHYCCYNQPMVTPPEALLVGYHVEQNFTDQEKHELFDKIKKILKLTTDKSADEIVMMRHELMCIFLQDGVCRVYSVRPAVCRACSSTSAKHCEKIFKSGNHMARLRCYQQIHEIFKTVHTNLVNQCRNMGCQSDPVRITEAISDYFNHSNPLESWLQGETVFHVR